MPDSHRPLNVWLPALRVGSGSDVFTQRLAEALRSIGHRPHVQWFDHHYELFPRALSREPVPRGIDVIHAGTTIGYAFAKRGIPLLATEHQYIRHPSFLTQRSMLQSVYHNMVLMPSLRATLRHADRVSTVSQHTAAAMAGVTGFTPSVVHNWVNADLFSPRPNFVREESGPLRLLFVGNPSRWKGVDVIPRIAARLGGKVEIRCMGGLRNEFPANLAVLENIRIVGRSEPGSMPQIYREVDAVLAPTRYEAFGYVALEAMSCGLPVVGFDSTGTAEVCVHGETALLGPMDDVDHLADNITLLFDMALRQRLGEAGRLRATTVFSERSAIDAYVEIYRDMILAAQKVNLASRSVDRE